MIGGWAPTGIAGAASGFAKMLKRFAGLLTLVGGLGFAGCAAAEEWATGELNENVPRWGFKIEMPDAGNVELQFNVSAIGTLPQAHAARIAVYHEQGEPVIGKEIDAGESYTFSFYLPRGTFWVVCDLGVEDVGEPIGRLRLEANGVIFNPATGAPIPVQTDYNGDIPPDPHYPRIPRIWLGGPIPLPLDYFLPIRSFTPPSAEDMLYLVDWA
jgi:hypothetical protein